MPRIVTRQSQAFTAVADTLSRFSDDIQLSFAASGLSIAGVGKDSSMIYRAEIPSEGRGDLIGPDEYSCRAPCRIAVDVAILLKVLGTVKAMGVVDISAPDAEPRDELLIRTTEREGDEDSERRGEGEVSIRLLRVVSHEGDYDMNAGFPCVFTISSKRFLLILERLSGLDDKRVGLEYRGGDTLRLSAGQYFASGVVSLKGATAETFPEGGGVFRGVFPSHNLRFPKACYAQCGSVTIGMSAGDGPMLVSVTVSTLATLRMAFMPMIDAAAE